MAIKTIFINLVYLKKRLTWLCDKNNISERLETPMSIAIEFGNLEICKWLYNMGAKDDINRVNNFGQSTVFLACKHGHIDICEWLLDNAC